MAKLNPLSKDPVEIGRMWYVPTDEPPPTGWCVCSEDFVLTTLQGAHAPGQTVKRTAGWLLIARCVRLCMMIAQAVIMLLASIPFLSWGVYMTARAMPRNAPGFFLRACYWKTKLGRLGVDSLIDQGVEITGAKRVEIGSRCHLDRHVLLTVGAGRGYIRIGDFAFLGPFCHVAGRGGVEIGPYAGLAARVLVYSVSNLPYHPERMGELISMSHSVPADRQYAHEATVTIGPYAVIGAFSVVMPGATLGRGCVVHGSSELSGTFPDFAIVSGHGRGKQQGWRRPAKLDPRLAEQDNDEST